MTLGFIVWDKVWTGSAIQLNAFKCTLASAMFAAVLSIWPSEARGLRGTWECGGSETCLPMLLLSAFIGITVGDNVWLQALKVLGARR